MRCQHHNAEYCVIVTVRIEQPQSVGDGIVLRNHRGMED